MRHLIDPMDLSVEEIQHLLELAEDIIRRSIRKSVNKKNLPLYFLNQVQERV